MSAQAKPKGASELVIHAALLGLSVVAAASLWTRDKQPKALAQGDATVWSGRSSDISKIVFEGKKKRVVLEAKKDDAGRYFVGTVEKEAAPAPDGSPPPDGKGPTGIVSITTADKLADMLAPLKAIRALGKVNDDKAGEFGLVTPESTIVVTVGGAERKLLLGGPTPGGGDRYVRESAGGEVFVIKGDAVRNLESADTLMIEREIHEWKEAEVARAKVSAGGKAREIVRGGQDTKRFWADAASRDAQDETLGNWMNKLDRLRPVDYALTPPGDKEVVVRVDFQAGSRALGHVELVKAKGASRAEYFIITERTRLYARVQANVAEQVEQDVSAIVK